MYLATTGSNSFMSSYDGFMLTSFLKRTNGKGRLMMLSLFKAMPHRTPNRKYFSNLGGSTCLTQTQVDSC